MYSHRPLSHADLETICTFPQSEEELFYVSPRFVYPLTPEQILELVANRFEPTVIVEDETGNAVAYANLYDKNADECWLGNVIVSPAHRGKGAAEVLINTMMHKAKHNQEIKILKLSCHNTNTRALAFYHKHHFKPYDLKTIHMKTKGIMTIQMKRQLA